MIEMKFMRQIYVTLLIVTVGILFYTCSSDDDPIIPEMAFATVIPNGADRYYLLEDNGTTYVPTQGTAIYPEYNENEKQWVQAFFNIVSDSVIGYDYSIQMIDLYKILTKPVAENKGSEENDRFYGNDPVRINNPKKDIWYGGGYLNIVYGTNYGGKEKHFVNLVKTKDPYIFEFRQNAYDDPSKYGADAIVAFDLNSFPNTEGETVDLTLVFNTFTGTEEYKIAFNSDSIKQKSQMNTHRKGLIEATEIR